MLAANTFPFRCKMRHKETLPAFARRMSVRTTTPGKNGAGASVWHIMPFTRIYYLIRINKATAASQERPGNE